MWCGVNVGLPHPVDSHVVTRTTPHLPSPHHTTLHHTYIHILYCVCKYTYVYARHFLFPGGCRLVLLLCSSRLLWCVVPAFATRPDKILKWRIASGVRAAVRHPPTRGRQQTASFQVIGKKEPQLKASNKYCCRLHIRMEGCPASGGLDGDLQKEAA